MHTYNIGDTVTYQDFGNDLVTGRVIGRGVNKGLPIFDLDTNRWGYDHQIVAVVPKKTVGEYLAAYAVGLSEALSRGLRQGQYAFNLLSETNSRLAEEVRGSLRDPFYRDDTLPEFFEFIVAKWDET